MDLTNGNIDFKGRVALYRAYDVARQQELEEIAEKFEDMKQKLEILSADLEDEKETRQNWRKRAQEAESAFRRSQFILVLVDGDGYIFKDSYLRDIHESGGARAAGDLYTEVQDYLRERNIIDPSGPDLQVMVNIYANKAGLTKYLYEADLVQSYSQVDQFFHSFTNSKALFQFIDCGYGKERADAKLRGMSSSFLMLSVLTSLDTYRFFAYDVHCKHIFLACCHDNGYVAELDRYRHDTIAAPKTILVDSAQMGRDYKTLNFPIARLNVFNTQPPSIVKKEPAPAAMPVLPRMPSVPSIEETASPSNGDVVSATPPSTWSAITASAASTTVKKPTKTASAPVPAPTSAPTIVPVTKPASPQLEFSDVNLAHTKGIPINRSGQRIDLKMVLPTSQDLDSFEERIASRKLCNKYHLAKDCYTYNCRYDHDPIDTKMKNTLRYKARSIPCQNGPQCRDADCFYGHQCPWGRDKCTNPKCAFVQRGMHNITDVEVAKYVPAEAY